MSRREGVGSVCLGELEAALQPLGGRCWIDTVRGVEASLTLACLKRENILCQRVAKFVREELACVGTEVRNRLDGW